MQNASAFSAPRRCTVHFADCCAARRYML